MKMKARILGFFLMVSIIFLTNYNFANAQNNSSGEQIKIMLKNFYTNYMSEFSIPVTAPLHTFEKYTDSLKRKYCTIRLLNRFKNQDLDFDPLIKGQDSDSAFAKTLIVKKSLGNSNIYTVSYYYLDLNKQKDITTINLIVVKQNGGYKIDSVW